MWLPSQNDCVIFMRSFLTFGLCGIFGILPDLDHIIAYSLGISNSSDVRIWHPTIFFVCCAIIFCYGAYLGGLYIRILLKKRKQDAGSKHD